MDLVPAIPGKPLHAHLQHALEFFGLVGNHFAFLGRVRHGLLNVHVFAALHGREGDGCMPMVGRGDEHRIDVRPLEHFLVVNVGLAPGAFAEAMLSRFW